MAIVNRIDLGENPGYATASPAGELRFIFRFVGFDCDNTAELNVIFEYGIPPMNCFGQRQYAKKWIALSAMPLGSPEFNAALQVITDPIVMRGAGGAKPNGSALNQLRTNHEIGPAWDLREFHVELPSHHLRPATTKQTPRHVLNETKTTTDYVTLNADAIKKGTYVVPLQFPAGTPFLGAQSLVTPDSIWNGNPPIPDAKARHLFSLGTCNGRSTICCAARTSSRRSQTRPVSSRGCSKSL